MKLTFNFPAKQKLSARSVQAILKEHFGDLFTIRITGETETTTEGRFRFIEGERLKVKNDETVYSVSITLVLMSHVKPELFIDDVTELFEKELGFPEGSIKNDIGYVRAAGMELNA